MRTFPSPGESGEGTEPPTSSPVHGGRLRWLTGSPLYLGYVGLANASAAIALNLFGGVFADRLDKRRLIFATQLITASFIFLPKSPPK